MNKPFKPTSDHILYHFYTYTIYISQVKIHWQIWQLVLIQVKKKQQITAFYIFPQMYPFSFLIRLLILIVPYLFDTE